MNVVVGGPLLTGGLSPSKHMGQGSRYENDDHDDDIKQKPSGCVTKLLEIIYSGLTTQITKTYRI